MIELAAEAGRDQGHLTRLGPAVETSGQRIVERLGAIDALCSGSEKDRSLSVDHFHLQRDHRLFVD